MQVSFDPKKTDLPEATVILGMVIPSFVKGCKARGDTLAEVQAGIAELISGVWGETPCAAGSDDQEG